MVLVVDVGNTNIVFGLYKGEVLDNFWRFATDSVKTADEVGVLITTVFYKWKIDEKQIESVLISSVVPTVMYSLIHGIEKYLGILPKVVSIDMKSNLKFTNVNNPSELGSDRFVGLVAAYEQYGGDTPLMVIDFGTATTYDVIDKDGEFVTGITSPGLKICAEALFDGTALLGKVEIKMPKSLITSDTVESVQAGLVYGHIGQTEYMIEKLKKIENGKYKNMKVVATGGFSRVISEGTSLFDYVEHDLTLYGIKLMHDFNC